jgi:uncharacterized protein YndB with AHSA1/START domain
MAMQGNVVSTERLIQAPAEAIFALLSDASKHPLIDGSGTVKKARAGGPERLELGSKFGMSMKAGISYRMVSTVIEFEDNRRIAWQSYPPGLSWLAGGRIWRYELEPQDGGTLVRESWDISEDHQRGLFKHVSIPEQARHSMEKTLERIEEITAGH